MSEQEELFRELHGHVEEEDFDDALGVCDKSDENAHPTPRHPITGTHAHMHARTHTKHTEHTHKARTLSTYTKHTLLLESHVCVPGVLQF